jgi:hypothetical protein
LAATAKLEQTFRPALICDVGVPKCGRRNERGFDRPDATAQEAVKDQLRRDAPAAMADYRRAYDAKIDRMFELRRMRLEGDKDTRNGQQRANG